LVGDTPALKYGSTFTVENPLVPLRKISIWNDAATGEIVVYDENDTDAIVDSGTPIQS
jgi:hypothetical protein